MAVFTVIFILSARPERFQKAAGKYKKAVLNNRQVLMAH